MFNVFNKPMIPIFFFFSGRKLREALAQIIQLAKVAAYNCNLLRTVKQGDSEVEASLD